MKRLPKWASLFTYLTAMLFGLSVLFTACAGEEDADDGEPAQQEQSDTPEAAEEDDTMDADAEM